jgi:predicted dienelactone hydrolase
MRLLPLLGLAVVLCFASLVRAEPYKRDAGPAKVETRLEDWRDDRRDRTVPVKLYVPTGLSAPAPIVLVSHGLGGSREGLSYVASHWASHGYFVVVMQHPGSDRSVWEGKPLDEARKDLVAAANAQQLVNRVFDAKFVIDEIARRNEREGDPLKGTLDLDHIAMTGHSFGAHTTLAIAGQKYSPIRGAGLQGLDERVSCAIPFSPSDVQRGDRDEAFGSIVIPVFHVTGTRDENPLNPAESPESRHVPFQHSVNSDRCLLVLDGATHSTFGGGEAEGRRRRAGSPSGEQLARFHDLVKQSTTAFLDANLRGDADARKWLLEGGFAAELGKTGTFEHRDAASK